MFADLNEILTKTIGVRKSNKGLPYASEVNRNISSALRALGHPARVVRWQMNEELGRGVGDAIARAKYIEVLDMRFFTYLEFGPMFFENTTGREQRKEINNMRLLMLLIAGMEQNGLDMGSHGRL